MTLPRVSILIPVYNRENYVGDCIQSALDQTITDVEIIVGDNASTDGTWQVCQSYASRDSRVRIFRNETNVGPVRNWLECASRAMGKYSKILWSDDLIHKEFLQKCIPFLEKDDVGFVYTAATLFRDIPAENGSGLLYDRLCTGTYSSSDYIEGVLLSETFPVSPGCAIFRTSDLVSNLWLQIPNSVGSDFSRHAIGNDLLLFLLTARDYPKFAVITEPLSSFRLHAGSISTSSSRSRLVVHYDLTKAFFAQKYMTDARLLSKLNTLFWLHLRKFNLAEYGVRSLSDFFPEAKDHKISYRYLFERCFRAVVAKVKNG